MCRKNITHLFLATFHNICSRFVKPLIVYGPFALFWSQGDFFCSDTNGDTEMLPGVTGAMGGHSAWLQANSLWYNWNRIKMVNYLNETIIKWKCTQGLKSPLIAEESGAEKELKLRFDVSQYSPEEIMVDYICVKLPFQLLFCELFPYSFTFSTIIQFR